MQNLIKVFRCFSVNTLSKKTKLMLNTEGFLPDWKTCVKKVITPAFLKRPKRKFYQ